MHNELLRHTLSTIQYRFEKALHGAGDDFGDFNLGKGSRTPAQIINHMSYLATAVNRIAEDGERIELGELPFPEEIERFQAALRNADILFKSRQLDLPLSKKLLQGPLADMLTHIGQIAMLQRLNDNAVPRGNFAAADIRTGLD